MPDDNTMMPVPDAASPASPGTTTGAPSTGAVGGGGTVGSTTDSGAPVAPPSGTPVGGGGNVTLDLPTLPPNYSQGNLGFFTRQTEVVPTSVTTGPDGALYVGELTGIPYPDGYARVLRIADPNATTGFDGKIPSGVSQTFASGFDEINSLGFDASGNLYVLEYVNSSAIYDPTLPPASLPPSKLIRVGTDGVRTTISGDELKLGNYLTVDKATGDVYVATNNADTTNGEIIRYHVDPATGMATNTVVANGLNNPRGMAFGPDGNLYVLESGVGTPVDSPDAASAPVIPFIPGLVSERGGSTGSITKVNVTTDDSQERIFTGLASFREFDPTTGQDRVISIGPNGITIASDGTVYVSSGGGLAPETADAIGPLGDLLKGVLRIDGLFGADPSKATITPEFDALAYATENGPDGATTLFNTESNLNDITIGADGKIYTIDAARNVVYGVKPGGSTLDSVTVLQKRPPVLTPSQYGAVFAAGGNPSADYQAEVGDVTFKGANGLPDTSGLGAGSSETPGTVPGDPAVAETDAMAMATGGATAGADMTGAQPAVASPTMAESNPLPSRGEDATVGMVNAAAAGSDTGLPTVPTGNVDPTALGPSDPVSPPVTPGNPYSNYFDPFVGNYAPATPAVIPAGANGSYSVSNVYSFGDRLADDGGTYSNYGAAQYLGQPTADSPVYYNHGLSDGPNWTDLLAQSLGTPTTSEDHNFAIGSSTTQVVNDPNDPYQTLGNFQGQIAFFQQQNQNFLPTDLVTVTFGGNDLTTPSSLSPAEAVTSTVKAITDGLQSLADLGAKHFLVSNLPDVTIAPVFSSPIGQQLFGDDPSALQGVVKQFNTELASALDTFKADTGLDVKELDLNKLFGGIVNDPSAYGFSNLTTPVLDNPPGVGLPQDFSAGDTPTQDPAVEHASLFTDPFFHPTALGQSIMAETAKSALG